MSDDHPWLDYSKETLPRGSSYVVGRDQIEAALHESGAALGHLSLYRPLAVDPAATSWIVLSVFWAGDGGSRYFGMQDRSAQSRLSMSWHALPSGQPERLRAELGDHWLPEACDWIAAAPSRGNVWQATDHRWTLTLIASAFQHEIN